MATVHLTQETFEQEVLNSEIPVLVDFWATWCGPCQMLSPVIDELAEEIDDVKICKVNVDEQPALARKFFVMSIPTMIVFKDGKPAKRHVGALSKEEILELLGK
jgi:thioredoxin 1